MKRSQGLRSLNKVLMNAIVSAVLSVAAVILLILLSFTLFLLMDSSFFSDLPLRPYSLYLFVAIAATAVLLVISLIFLFKNVAAISLEGNGRYAAQQNGTEEQTAIGEEEVLQFLDDGEKEIYSILVDAGGTVLQRDITSVKGYSKATITRILTRLESKGIVERLRHGTTNQVVLKRVSKQISGK